MRIVVVTSQIQYTSATA